MFLSNALRRGNWINKKRVVAYPAIFFCIYLFMAAVWVFNIPLIPDHKGLEFSHDFINVYAAGVASHEGHPANVYDWDKQKNLEHQIEESGKGPTPWNGYVPWLYPPIFLGVAWLLAFLPYYYALAAYIVAGYAAYGAAVYKLARYKESKWAIAAFPGICNNLLAGQNGFITTASLAAGIYFLDASPIAAGAFFGMLSYKPQFFVLIPLALAVGRYWKALIATSASAAVYACASVAAFGLDPWQGFIRSLPLVRENILEKNENQWLRSMHTVFSEVRMYGGELHTAYALQAIVSIAAVLFLVWIWSRRPSLAVRGASLCAVLLLASPYSYGYDQVLLAIPIALLAREGMQSGFLPFEKTFLFALWLLPTFFQIMGEVFAIPLTPVLLIGLMWVCWRRGKRNNL